MADAGAMAVEAEVSCLVGIILIKDQVTLLGAGTGVLFVAMGAISPGEAGRGDLRPGHPIGVVAVGGVHIRPGGLDKPWVKRGRAEGRNQEKGPKVAVSHNRHHKVKEQDFSHAFEMTAFFRLFATPSFIGKFAKSLEMAKQKSSDPRRANFEE
jgi:hypothetical protein